MKMQSQMKNEAMDGALKEPGGKGKTEGLLIDRSCDFSRGKRNAMPVLTALFKNGRLMSA